MLKKILIQGANFIYAFFKILPVKNKITMISRQSNEKSIDFELLENEFNKTYPKLKIRILCHELKGGAKASFGNKIKYAFHCLKQMYHIATSKAVILDSYCILVSILKHRKNLKIIQMWHSMGTMKKFGYQILGQEEGSDKKLAQEMKMHANYNYIFASSNAYAKNLVAGFGYGVDYVRIYPLPRVDLLSSKTYKEEIQNKIKEVYPQITQKKNIVYCPTFRKDEKKMKQELDSIITNVDYDKYNLIIKLHPLSKIKVTDTRAICDHQFSSFEMLFIADYMISDYSCIIYEAAVLKIPIYFWAFDLDQYLNTRGLTVDYTTEFPGMHSKNIKDILEEIEKDNYDLEKLEQFRKKYIVKTDNCTKDIVQFVVHEIGKVDNKNE